MSSKSLKRRLQEAAEMSAVAEITCEELVGVNVWRDQTHFHLRPFALARVFRLLEVPRRKLDIRTSAKGDLHIDFTARGFWWCAVVLAPDIAEWERLSGHHFTARLEQRPLALTLAEAGP